MMDKILSIEELKIVLRNKKEDGMSIVFTNGCFDILHIGHARYLAEASKQGDILIVGLNSDDSVRRLKGSKRPLVIEEERAELLSYLEMIDYIVIFDDLTAKNVILSLKPDIYVKGGDYNIEELPEAEVVAEIGAEIVLIPMVEGVSTTNIVDKIINRYNI